MPILESILRRPAFTAWNIIEVSASYVQVGKEEYVLGQ